MRSLWCSNLVRSLHFSSTRIFLGYPLNFCSLRSILLRALISFAFCAYLSNESWRRISVYSRRLSWSLTLAFDSFNSYLMFYWVFIRPSMVHWRTRSCMSYFAVSFLNSLDFCLKFLEPLIFLSLFSSFRSAGENSSLLFCFLTVRA